MIFDRLGRWRLPAIAGISLLIALAVVVAILVLGRAPTVIDSSPSASTNETGVETAPPGDTPEAAVRAFFEAFAEARETDDPALIEPFVNGTGSSAYQTAAGFLLGQQGVGKASITTVNELTGFHVETDGDRAVVTFDHLVGGYDVDLDTGAPLESPMVLPERRKMAATVLVEGRWLVDSFDNVAP